MDQQDDVMSSHKAKHYGLEFRRQWWSYFVSIALTVLAFLAVGWNCFSKFLQYSDVPYFVSCHSDRVPVIFLHAPKGKGAFFPLNIYSSRCFICDCYCNWD